MQRERRDESPRVFCHRRRQPAEPLFQTVNLAADGLGLSPREYIALLSKLAEETSPQPDYYSNGGAIEELERRFARLLGKEAAIFPPTGTLANHLAVRKLAGTFCRRARGHRGRCDRG